MKYKNLFAVIAYLFISSVALAQNHYTFIGKAAEIPINGTSKIIAASPIDLPSPHRIVPLQVKVTMPVTSAKSGVNTHPVIILSHGHGNSNYLSSYKGYGPIADFLAAHGFIVIQPTHLDSKALQLNPNGPEGPTYPVSRIKDISIILNHLDVIENEFPEVKNKMDKDRIAIIGHSMGAFNAGIYLGEQNTDKNGKVFAISEPRIKAGVLMSAPGNAEGINPIVAKAFLDYNPNFSTMNKPTLFFVGDQDDSKQETNKGYIWHADGYKESTGSKSIVILKGAQHNLGGISGYDAAEAKDENPECAAIVERLSWAYLWSALYPDDHAWEKASAAFNKMNELGTLKSKN